MAWGKSKAQAPPSTWSQLLPLIITLLFVGGLAWVGYHIYLSITKISETASQKMGSKNVVFTKDGMKVGVREVKDESYVDATQSWVVKAWTLGADSKEEERKKKKEKKGR